MEDENKNVRNISGIIRPATREDVSQILEIYNDAILHTTAVYYDEPISLQAWHNWFDDRMKNNFPVLVATENRAVTGFSTYGHFVERIGYRFTVEHSVYVAEKHRGKGIASTLMQAIIADAQQKNYHVMLGKIDAENEVSIQLHKKFGFEEVGHLKQAGFKFNRWLDVKILQLMLGTD
jgi:phosphinothricin acetyltransferase